MSDVPPSPAEQRAADAAEARATRRRWITLAEFVAVAGLLVAVASLWLSWSDRRADQADKQAEKVETTRSQARVLLAGAVAKDGETITLGDPAHQLHDVEVTFPTPLGLSPQSSMFGTNIEASWFGDKVLAATDRRAGRLPVILAATWWDGDTKRTDRAIYDIAWQSVHGGLPIFGGRKLVMRALSLRERSASQAALDAAWARETGAK